MSHFDINPTVKLFCWVLLLASNEGKSHHQCRGINIGISIVIAKILFLSSEFFF